MNPFYKDRSSKLSDHRKISKKSNFSRNFNPLKEYLIPSEISDDEDGTWEQDTLYYSFPNTPIQEMLKQDVPYLKREDEQRSTIDNRTTGAETAVNEQEIKLDNAQILDHDYVDLDHLNMILQKER